MEDKQDSSSEKSGQWECAICFEELRIEQSCLTSCGRKLFVWFLRCCLLILWSSFLFFLLFLFVLC
jgi:hypothetical protein